MFLSGRKELVVIKLICSVFYLMVKNDSKMSNDNGFKWDTKSTEVFRGRKKTTVMNFTI